MKFDLQGRIAAATAFLRLLEAIQECSDIHERAGIEMPELPCAPAARLSKPSKEEEVEGESEDDTNVSLLPVLSSPIAPDRPLEAGNDWVYLPVEEAAPTSLLLACLKDSHNRATMADLLQQVRKYLPEVAKNSVYNIVARLVETGSAIRTEEGVVLIKPDIAGTIYENYLWAPIAQLLPPEITWHRRMGIIHAFNTCGELQVNQIVALLNAAEWMKAKANKDVVKLDLHVLNDKGSIKRVPGTRRWQIANEKEAPEETS